MFIHIAAIVSVITLCDGELSAHHEPNKSLPQKPPDHAISSQSYVREDVPLSYGFKTIHTKTNAKPQYPASAQQAKAPAHQNPPAQQLHTAEEDHGLYKTIFSYPLQQSIRKNLRTKHDVVPNTFPFTLIPVSKFTSNPVSTQQLQKGFNIEYSQTHAPPQESQHTRQGRYNVNRKHPAPVLETHLQKPSSRIILDSPSKLYFVRHPAAYTKNTKLATAKLHKNIFHEHPGLQIEKGNVPQLTNRYLKYDALYPAGAGGGAGDASAGNTKKAFPAHVRAIFKKAADAMEIAPKTKMYPTNKSKNRYMVV